MTNLIVDLPTNLRDLSIGTCVVRFSMGFVMIDLFANFSYLLLLLFLCFFSSRMFTWPSVAQMFTQCLDSAAHLLWICYVSETEVVRIAGALIHLWACVADPGAFWATGC